MAAQATLNIPTPEGATRLLSRFFDDEGLNGETLLTAVDLILKRTDVFLDDALAVTEETNGFKSACAAGCGFCCHTLVSVSPPEAFYIARHIDTAFEPEAREALKAKVIEYVARTKDMDGAQRYVSREACPFLRPDDWYCGLHMARPLVCRAMHSGSLPACKTAYENRDATVPAPTMAVFFENTKAYMSAYVSTLRPRGLHVYPVELSGALAVIWQTPDALDRWLGGADLFDTARLPVREVVREVPPTR
jgi:Fe-S-cluster containining protein